MKQQVSSHDFLLCWQQQEKGEVICVPVALPASTSAHTPAEENQRFHQQTRKNPSDNANLGFQAVGPALRIMQLNIEG